MWRSGRVLIVAALCAVWLPGCEKLKEMSLEEPVKIPAPEPVVHAAPAPVITPPPAPVVRTPADIIAEFQALPSYQRTDERLTEVAQQPGAAEAFRELDLQKSPVSIAGLQAAGALTQLEALNLAGTQLRSDALRDVSRWPVLKTLVLDQTQVDGTVAAHLAQLKALQHLSLCETSITDASLAELKDLPLEELRLDGNPNLNGRDFGAAIKSGGFRELRLLSANGSRLGFHGLDHAGSLRHLQELHLRQGELPDAALKSLAGCGALRILDLRENPLTNAGGVHLSKVKSLEDLNLQGCRAITDDVFNALKNLKQLKRLDVSQTGCTLAAVKVLKEKFLKDTTIVFDGHEF